MSTKNRELNRAERAKVIQREQAAGERNRRILITLAIVVVLSAVVAAGVVFSSGGNKKPEATSALPPATAQGQALVMGDNAKAATKVVVYEDFLCPYCRQFETSTRDFLQAAADKGTVQVEYRPFHLLQDDYSTRALSAWASVLQEGTPTQALSYHDLLYDKQPYEASPDKPDGAKLAEWAKESGVTSSSVLDSVKKADDPAFVNAADAAATKAGVDGTPTVFVNGKPLQGSSVSDMADNLEKLVSGS
jgi:protein-disulfide isomerase